MDLVLPDEGNDYYNILRKEQKNLAKLKVQAIAQSHCACKHTAANAKLAKLKLVE